MLADAIHESGHAVVCVRLGYGHMLKSVTLDFCKYIIEPDRIPFRAWFVMSHAGPAASERHCRLNGMEVRKQSAGDARWRLGMATRYPKEAAALPAPAILEREAGALVAANWDSIERVAIELDRRGELTGAEVEKIAIIARWQTVSVAKSKSAPVT
jgi:hypothetical protein